MPNRMLLTDTCRLMRRVCDAAKQNVRRRKLNSAFTLTGYLLAVALLQACDRTPESVFVLNAPQTVRLTASASTLSARAGEPVVLYAERKTQGSWTRIPSKELKPDQCWVAALPPERETAVADNIHWVVEPEGEAVFNIDVRPDHTRTVVLSKPGIFTLTPSTSVWCEPGRSVPASPLRIEATAR
jgi:hypothetical protein